MKCPKCTSANLSKSGPESPYSCMTCKGVWLKFPDVETFSRAYEDIPDGKFDMDNVRDNRTGLCPEGHGILVRAKIPGDDAYYLEKCMTCGGIWFDQGELKILIENNLLHYLPELWTVQYRRQQIRKMDSENFKKLNEELLGTEIYGLILELARKIKQHPEKNRVFDLLRHELKS